MLPKRWWGGNSSLNLDTYLRFPVNVFLKMTNKENECQQFLLKPQNWKPLLKFWGLLELFPTENLLKCTAEEVFRDPCYFLNIWSPRCSDPWDCIISSIVPSRSAFHPSDLSLLILKRDLVIVFIDVSYIFLPGSFLSAYLSLEILWMQLYISRLGLIYSGKHRHCQEWKKRSQLC